MFLVLTASAGAAAPVAEAGTALMAYVADTVVLDGRGSYDDDGDTLTYAWEQIGGPTMALDATDIAQPRFEVTEPGTLRFRLVVSDAAEASAPDDVEVIVPYQKTGEPAGCATAVGPAGLGLCGLLLLRKR